MKTLMGIRGKGYELPPTSVVLESLQHDTRLYRDEIKPGTALMKHVEARLKKDIEDRRNKRDKKWTKINVIISGTDVSGEGEHKCMPFIKQSNKNETHAIFSPDTDVGLLGLLTKKRNIYVYSRSRGNISVVGPGKEKGGVDVEKNTSSVKAQVNNDVVGQGQEELYEMTEMSALIEVVTKALKIKDNEGELDWNQILDFVFLCIPQGNDYLPGPDHQSFKLDHLIDCYRGSSGEYLTDNGKINFENLRRFLARLESKERESIVERKVRDMKRKFMDEARRKLHPWPKSKSDWKNWRDDQHKQFEMLEKDIFSDENQMSIIWQDYRTELYKRIDIDPKDLEDIARNYMKNWNSIWQHIIDGCTDWRGLQGVKSVPLASDLCQSNCKELWTKENPGWHLSILANLFLLFKSKCIDILSEEDRQASIIQDVKTLYGDAEEMDCKKKLLDVDAQLERLGKANIPSMIMAEETAEAIIYPSSEGIPKNVIRSKEEVHTSIVDESLRPFKFTLRPVDAEEQQ